MKALLIAYALTATVVWGRGQAYYEDNIIQPVSTLYGNNSLGRTVSRINQQSTNPNAFATSELTASYVDRSKFYRKNNLPQQELLIARLAWLEYLANVFVEAEWPVMAHLLMGRMEMMGEGVPGVQAPLRQAVQQIKERLGERMQPIVPTVKQRVPAGPSRQVDYSGRKPVVPSPPHRSSPHPKKSSRKKGKKKRGLGIIAGLKKVAHKAYDVITHHEHSSHQTNVNQARANTQSPVDWRADSTPHSAMHYTPGGVTGSHSSFAEEHPSQLVNQVMQALLQRRLDEALAMVLQDRHSPPEITSKLRLVTSLALFDREHFDTCVPLWDSAWRLSWQDKLVILEAALNDNASGQHVAQRVPHGTSVLARLSLIPPKQSFAANNNALASIRYIDANVVDPVEHAVLTACWQQHYSSRALQDALPTLLMAHRSQLGRRTGSVRWEGRDRHPSPSNTVSEEAIGDILRDVEVHLASGRWDLPVHVGPFAMVFPAHTAIQPPARATAATRFLEESVEKDLLIARLREVMSLGEHLDLASLEQASKARIFGMYHRLHDLAKRDAHATQLNLQLTTSERQARAKEMHVLRRKLQHAIEQDHKAKRERVANDQRAAQLDRASAHYHAAMSRLHSDFQSRYAELVKRDSQEFAQVSIEERQAQHRLLAQQQEQASQAIRARYEAEVKAIERAFWEAMQAAHIQSERNVPGDNDLYERNVFRAGTMPPARQNYRPQNQQPPYYDNRSRDDQSRYSYGQQTPQSFREPLSTVPIAPSASIAPISPSPSSFSPSTNSGQNKEDGSFWSRAGEAVVDGALALAPLQQLFF